MNASRTPLILLVALILGTTGALLVTNSSAPSARRSDIATMTAREEHPQSPTALRSMSSRWSSSAPIFVNTMAPEKATGNEPAVAIPTAKEEREQILSSIAQSGRSQGPWQSEARNALVDFKRAAESVSGLQFSDFECFARGCVSMATYANQSSFDGGHAVASKLLRSAWPQGGKIFIAPEVQTDGRVMSAIVFLKPDQGGRQ
jgi:hypothetical protein